MALTKVSGGILDPGIDVAGIVTATGFDGPFIGGSGKNIVAGIITCTELDLNGNGNISGNLVIDGNLTANGDFTTLNTTLREVEILRVDANTTAVAGIITQRGSGDILNLYDSSTEVFSVDASGRVKIGTTSNKPAAANEAGIVFGDNTAGTVKKGVASFCADGAAPLLLTRRVSDGNVLGIADDVGTKGLIRVNSDNLEITSIYALTLATGTGHNQKVRLTNDGKVGIGSMIPAAKLDVNGTSKFQDNVSFTTANGNGIIISKSSNYMMFGNSVTQYFGGSSMWLMHNGSTGYLHNVTGSLYIRNESAGDIYIQGKSGENSIICNDNGAVELYYDDIKTAFTQQDAWNVYGRTSNSGMIEIASNQGANNNDRFRIHKTSAASRLTIQNYSTGSWVENIRITAGGAVELKHADGTTKFETTSAGSKISGNLELSSTYPSLTWTDTNHNSDFRITNNDGTLIVYDITRGAHVLDFKPTGDIKIPVDNKKLIFGVDEELSITHTGSNSDIVHAGTGRLRLLGNYFTIANAAGNQDYIRANLSSSVTLYHSGNAKLTTSTTGITVTGEVAASQDYPNFRPTLDLNFAGTSKLDSRVTFTREGSGSYYGKDGLLKFAATNEPRFDHDPITRECKGLLIEEQRQNWASNSYRVSNDDGATNYDHGYNMINGAVTINDFGTAPDGTNTATKMYPASSGAARGIELIMSLSGTGNWTTSLYVKASGHTGWIALYGVDGGTRAYFNPTTGAAGQAGTYPGTPAAGKYGIQDVGNGWYRCHLTINLTTTGGTEYFYLYFGDSDGSVSVTHSGTNGVLMWGLQIEKGDFPTSYIRTDSNLKQYRGADQCYIDGQDFLDFYNQTEGTVISSHSILDHIPSTHNLYTYQISPTGATAYAPLRLLDKNGSYGNSLTAASVYNNSTVFLVQDTGNPVTVAGRKYKVAVSIKKDDYDAVFDGGDLKSDGSGDLYTADHMSIGYYKPVPQAYLNGHIQRLTYYPFKLTNNQLKTITS